MIQANISKQKQPKNKIIKTVVMAILLLILGIGIWVGYTAFVSLGKITGDSGQSFGKSILTFLGDKNEFNLKGRSEGRTNILLLGIGGTGHSGGTLSDTIILMSINWSDKKVALMSVPRDLYVSIPNYGKAKINAAYAYGEKEAKKTGGGGKLLSTVIENVTGQDVHYFITIDFNGFKKLIDALGGVDIYVEKALYDPFYPAPNMIDYQVLKIPAGMQHMDGTLALKYARSRETTSDFDRSRRQQQVILAIKDKVISAETLTNPKKLTDLLNILGDHLRTDLTIGEIKALWDSIKDVNSESIINKVLDTAPGSPLTSAQDERGYIIIPKKGESNFTDIQKIAKNIFDEEQNTAKDLSIEVLNGTGQTGLAKQIGQLLASYGYNIDSYGNATNVYAKSVVNNCAGKDGEAKSLELAKILSATVKTKTNCNYDIQIIVGKDNISSDDANQ